MWFTRHDEELQNNFQLKHQRQQDKGWGAGVTARLATDLHTQLPQQVKGFSERNLKFMIQFYKQYPANEIGKQPVSQLEKQLLPEVVSSLPWGHLILLRQKIKDTTLREWYMHQTLANGWSRDTLAMMIQRQLHTRQGGCHHQLYPTATGSAVGPGAAKPERSVYL
jgi:predicted nuclease of restriction endonuclease-like (RecB) superfamily